MTFKKLPPNALNSIHAFKMDDEILFLTSDHKLLFSFIAYLCNRYENRAKVSLPSLNNKCGFGSIEFTEIILRDLIRIGVVSVEPELFKTDNSIIITVHPFVHEVVVGKTIPLEKVFSVGFGLDVPRALKLFGEEM